MIEQRREEKYENNESHKPPFPVDVGVAPVKATY